jgi:demethylmacrocin O-methyltransferase
MILGKYMEKYKQAGPIFKFFKKALNLQQRRALKNIVANIYPWDLNKLALIYGSDKWGGHFYTTHYHEHFHKLRNKKLRILEIGVGGYESPHFGGESLRMWKRYFPQSMIYSIDIYDKSALQEKRIRIFQGDQANEAFLRKICEEAGPFDIIIDDGSHIVSHVLTSFKTLFPLMKEDGIYAIEDIQTSYWPGFGGNSERLDDPVTSMNLLKKLTDGLNYREFELPDYAASYFDKHIVAMHFYHNLVIICKGHNDEPRYPPIASQPNM